MIILPTILLIFSQACVVFCETELLILHTNDARAHFDEMSGLTNGYCSQALKKQYQCMGGLSRAAAIINKHRRMYEQGKGPRPLFFYDGSLFTGSIWFRMFKTNISAEFMNVIQPDAINIGKSEFHYDLKTLGDFIAGLKVPVLSTNYHTAGEPLLSNVKRYVKIVVGSLTIGVMGYIEQKVQDWAGFGVHLGGEEDIVEAAKQLHYEGADFIILMSADGHKRDLEFARTVPFLDLVIGGGGKTLLWNRDDEPPPEQIEVAGPYPMVVTSKAGGHKMRYVVRTLPFARYLGALRLTINRQGVVTKFSGQPVFLSQELPLDKDAEALLDVYRPQVLKMASVVLATSKTYLQGSTHRCSIGECNMGSMICDAYVAHMTEKWPAYPNWSYVSVCIIAASSLESDVDPLMNDNKVTRMEMMEIRPFSDTLCIMSLRGDQLMKMLQLGAESAYHGAPSGDFLQVSGIRMTIDRSAPRGRRVTRATVRSANCKVPRFEPLDLYRTYNVVTSRFLGDGHWGGNLLTEFGSFKRWYEHTEDMAVIEEYLAKMPLMFPENDGRITMEQTVKDTSTGHMNSYSVFFVVALFVHVLPM